MGLLDNKVILIVGGTSGIGEAAAIEAALNGAKVVVSGRREDFGNKVVEAIKKRGGEAIFVKCDVTKEEDVKNLVAKTVEKYGRLDGAFNNAGIANSFGSIDTLSSQDYHKVLSANLDSVFYCLKYEIQQIKKQYKENPSDKALYSIINCSSVAALYSQSNFGHYSASKAAIDSLTKTAAVENGVNPTIRINSILPGPIQTDILSWTGLEADEVLKPFTEKTLFKRSGKVEEVAKPVVFLLSDQASFINGVQLPIDGGLLLH